MKGKVKFWNAGKGYGFIKGEDNNDYFFHHTQVKDFTPAKEDLVEFEVEEANRGLQAVNVRKVGAT